MLVARPAQPDDRNALQTLTRYETRVHAHLDWKPVEDWLGDQPFWVAERGRRLVAALACPPDLPDTAWIRLLVVADGLDADAAWSVLWPPARDGLAQQGLQMVAGLSLDAWTSPLYEAGGLTRTHDVVVLSRLPGPSLPAASPGGARIRPARTADRSAIAAVDIAAFAAPWQLSVGMIRLALGQADYVSVAERDGQVIGYQLTTPSRNGAHLARLAVLPGEHGAGLGTALVADLIDHYERAGGREITVNNQHDNQASLAVYRRLGFVLTGTRFPVYQLAL